MSEITRTLNWFKQAVPNPTAETLCVQIGCHYEEVAEMAEVLCDGYEHGKLKELSGEYKRKDNMHIVHSNRILSDSDTHVELLDALCDQIVTAVGVAYMMSFDIDGALAEVNRSNYSKFVNGVPQFNENGKIAKGSDYTAPDLTPFIGGGK